MATEQLRLTDAERANLVAYLDSELPDHESKRLFAKLSKSVTGQREIESLKKTWELLDCLPRATPSPALVEKTLTEVLQFDAQSGRFVDVAGRAWKTAARIAILAASAMLTVAIGYSVTRWIWPDPSARLVRDLNLAEHLDEYRAVRSFDFLEQLDKSPAFNVDDTD